MAGIDANTVLMLHMDGTGNSFIDSSSSNHTVTANGDVTQTSTQFKWGNSAVFDGNDYLSLSDSDDWYMSGDYTIDFWVYRTAGSGTQVLVDQFDYLSSGYFIVFFENDNLRVAYGFGGGNTNTRLSSYNITNNQWVHIAFEKTGTTLNLYANGTNVLSATETTAFVNVNQILTIGSRSGAIGFTGYIDELRFSNTARYQGDFTPETVPYSEGAEPAPAPILCWQATGRFPSGKTFQATGPDKFPKDFIWPNNLIEKQVVEDGIQII